MHGSDPFPMSQTVGEEAEFWVPSAAAKLGYFVVVVVFVFVVVVVVVVVLFSLNYYNY